MQGCLDVRPSNRLDESADHVVVLITGTVIADGSLVHGALDHVSGDHDLIHGCRTGSRLLEEGQGASGVGPGETNDHGARIGVQLVLAGQSTIFAQCPIQQHRDVLVSERFESQQQRAGQQRRDHRKARVLCRRGDECDQPILYGRQEHVLLGLGKAMDFVNEEHRLPRGSQVSSGLIKNRPDLLHTRGHRGELDESRITLTGDDRRDRGLADTRRPPEEDRHGFARGKPTEWGSRPHEVVLPQDLFQCPRPHAYSERQAGAIGIGQAATRVGRLTADGAAEEILAHRQ